MINVFIYSILIMPTSPGAWFWVFVFKRKKNPFYSKNWNFYNWICSVSNYANMYNLPLCICIQRKTLQFINLYYDRVCLHINAIQVKCKFSIDINEIPHISKTFTKISRKKKNEKIIRFYSLSTKSTIYYLNTWSAQLNAACADYMYVKRR